MEKTAVIVLVFVLLKGCLNFQCCIDDICSPPQIPPRKNQPKFGLQPTIRLNGCSCEKDPEKESIVCTGRTSCRKFPRDLNVSTEYLAVTTTALEGIQKYDLVEFEDLRRLDIENNNNLVRIEEFSFVNLKKLVNLSISYNPALTFLRPKTFSGATGLKELYLVGNGFHSILDISPALARKYLPNLYNLVLKENNFESVNATDFRPMSNSSLQKLNLAQCRIEYINANSLNYLTHLEVLTIGLNNLHEIVLTNLLTRMTLYKIPLKFLNLFKSGLRKRPSHDLMKAIDKSGVECLSMAGNKFEIINKKTFPAMRNLKMIDLRDVFAFDITENAFYQFSSLKTLLLANNKFQKVPLGARLKGLSYLDLSQNSKDFYSNSYFNIQNLTFQNMSVLQVLDLSYNNVQTIFRNTLLGLNNLRILSLKGCDIFFIEPGSFRAVENLIFLDLENNYFLLSEDIGNVFEGLENLEVLLLSRNNMTHLSNTTFSSLIALKHLSLDKNFLTHLDPSFFMSPTYLHTIDLSDNMIMPWNNRIFDNQDVLEVLLLSGNRITNFSVAMLEDFGNRSEVDLRSNKFICNCELYNTLNLRNDTKEVLVDSQARCFPREILVADFLLASTRTNTCGLDLLLILIPAVSLVVLLSGFIYSWYAYRDHFRYFAFLTKMHLIKIGKIMPSKSCSYTNYVYDAFVSYSNENSDFVAKLTRMLENYEPFFKLCIYERDFPAGTILSETILDNVSKSRKILLVVSDSFVKSTWCQWETHIAQNHDLFFKNHKNPESVVDDSLILVTLGEIKAKHLTPTLKYLLRTRIYLQWDDDECKQTKFWNKLRENLARGKCEIPVYDPSPP